MRKLLLADDSVTIQRVIELTFSGEDIQVVAVNDGEQAIARIPAEQPDVVLADIGMPRKGGYDVASFVKGRPDLSHIPVLLLAGAFEPVDQTRAEQVGADGVLIKPFEPRQVIERVKELLAAVRPTISAELVPQPGGPVQDAAAPEPASPEPAVVEAAGVDTVSNEHVEPAPLEAAPAEAAPVGTPAAPQVQSLDDLFESLNQALSERTAATAAPPAPPTSPAASVAQGQAPWMTPTSMPDNKSFDSASFDTASRPSTSAATLDDYFDRLSAAFSHSHPASEAETLPDRIDDFAGVAAHEPPAASHEWLSQVGEPEGLQAFEMGEGEGNPLLGAVSTLMARAASPHDPGSASEARHSVNGMSKPPAQHVPATTPTHAVPPADLVEVVTERVLARLVPDITENLRRLVREEIARQR